MTKTYLCKQLNRFMEETNEEEVFIKSIPPNKEISDYILWHNEGHRTAIKTMFNVISSEKEHLNRNRLRKFLKNKIKRIDYNLRKLDDIIQSKEDEEIIWNKDYFILDGISCAYLTILRMINKECYIRKTMGGSK